MEKPIETQVVIIGAGSTGTVIARELSKYKVDAILVDKAVDVGCGETRSSHGSVYSSKGLSWASSLVLKSMVLEPKDRGSLLHPESLKERLTLKGFNMFDSLAKDIDLSSYSRIKRIMIATNDDELKKLEVTEELCKQMDFEVQRLGRDDMLALEPNVATKTIRALSDTASASNMYPWEYVIALAENAKANGVRIMLGAEVKAITPVSGGFAVQTTRRPIKTEFIINAAGPYSDKIAQMADVCDFGLRFVKSEMLVLDKRLKGLINSHIGTPPSPGSPRSVKPTASGNIHTVCHEYIPVEDPEDVYTKREWGVANIVGAQELVPSLQEKDIITSFSGVRVFNTRDPNDHIIEVSKKNPNFINVIIRLPGVSASPAIAEYVVGLLGNQGLALTTNPDFNPHRKGIPQVSKLPDQQKEQLIAKDSRYGHVVCSCEKVTEGEIVEAIRRGARTVQGVKYRTRSTMGRCQGNFCLPCVVKLLARELEIPVYDVTLKSSLSHALLHRSEELLSFGE